MEILKYPISTEKAIRAIESNNIITFIVDKKATKGTIKQEFEKRFKVKLDSVKLLISTKGQKKAYVRLKKAYPALDIATQLGLM